MLEYIKIISIMLLFVSVIGYILVVLKEKIYLMKNIILINKKSVKPEHINQIDIKEFLLNGIRIKSGDEIKIILNTKEKINGIVIGAKKKENSIIIVTHKDKVKKFNVNTIKTIKLVSKYGSFF